MLLAVGRIAGTHGLRGEVKVESYSGEFNHFEALGKVLLRKGESERESSIESTKMSGGKVVVALEGVDSVEDAARLTGWEIFASRQKAAPLGDEEYYIADLIGMEVTCEGERVGVVSNVYDGAQSELIEVDRGGRRSLFPFLKVYVTSVDPEGRRMELSGAWLLE
ncbi:MAG: ribosome maturation factor RimM [Alkalispirochaetaceae bacterium]